MKLTKTQIERYENYLWNIYNDFMLNSRIKNCIPSPKLENALIEKIIEFIDEMTKQARYSINHKLKFQFISEKIFKWKNILLYEFNKLVEIRISPPQRLF